MQPGRPAHRPTGMPLRRRALVLVLALVTAGCTTSAGVGAPEPSTGSPVSRAQRDAAARLAAFRPPPGAVRLPHEPSDAHELDHPNLPDSSNLAIATSWWRVPGEPGAVLAALATPDGAERGSSWDAGGPDTMTYGVEFHWPTRDTLPGRNLIVSATRVGDATVLRVDSVTVWVPEAGLSAAVPSTARSLVVTYQRFVPEAKRYGPVTVTDPVQIATVADLVNSLSVEPYGPRPCPMPSGELRLSFRSVDGAEVAHVQASMSGCDDVYVDRGTTHTILAGAGTLTRSVLAALHLPWGTG
jgi:predicted small secreted protein